MSFKFIHSSPSFHSVMYFIHFISCHFVSFSFHVILFHSLHSLIQFNHSFHSFQFIRFLSFIHFFLSLIHSCIHSFTTYIHAYIHTHILLYVGVASEGSGLRGWALSVGFGVQGLSSLGGFGLPKAFVCCGYSPPPPPAPIIHHVAGRPAPLGPTLKAWSLSRTPLNPETPPQNSRHFCEALSFQLSAAGPKDCKNVVFYFIIRYMCVYIYIYCVIK